ncbi:MAG: 4-hydroxybenzoate octaprenyltransferase [Rhodobacteraceae bacterium]|nr:4-hydroxybenzoate octaprenyltransferase [Paracoccaceae bacterium]
MIHIQHEQDDGVPDSVAGNWVDRHAPASWRPYFRLSRLDRPIGTWLLLLPCWWGLLLAANMTGAWTIGHTWIAMACAIGAVLMRGAGCTWNDITDRDLDARVARTRSRPLPSGQIRISHAAIWLTLQSLIAFAILLTFNRFTIMLGVASLITVVIYPFAKRFTWWPQIFLGIAFNWGALLGWAAVTGSLGPAPLLLYLAGITWTLYYDTIYAHQDIEDDALVGIKSTARLFGDRSRICLWVFLAASTGLYALALILALPDESTILDGALYAGAVIGFGAHMIMQMRRLDLNDPASCLAAFRSMRNTGLLPCLFLAPALLL